MAYAILRTAKLKEVGHIAGSLSHTFRTRETPNASKARAHLNENSGPETPEAILNAIKDRLPEKVRKNGVRCIEYFIGASPEHFQNGETGAGYFEDAKRWLIEKHGAENVISTHIHRDETTPHMVAYVVPITRDGKLSAREFLGGPEAMRQLQTDFAERVGKRHGLERGIEGSKAKHQSISEYYARVNQTMDASKIIYPNERASKGLLSKESDAEFAERVAKTVAGRVVGDRAKANELGAAQRREREQALEIARLRKQLKDLEPWRELFQGMPAIDQAILRREAGVIARGMRRAAVEVVGIVKALTDRAVTVQKADGELHNGTPLAASALMKAGVKIGDLVVLKGNVANFLKSAQDLQREIANKVQNRGRDGGRGGRGR